MRVMSREVGVDERPGHYRREVLGRVDRLENRLAKPLQIRSLVPDDPSLLRWRLRTHQELASGRPDQSSTRRNRRGTA